MELPDILYRVVWNRRAWAYPTGDEKDTDAYAGNSGYGHEEWNFAYDDAMDDFVYGYVYRKPNDLPKKGQTTFSVGFWSISSDTKDWYFVGKYEEAEKVPAADHKKLDAHYSKNGIYDRRVEELLPVTEDRSNYQALGGKFYDFTTMKFAKRKKTLRDDLVANVIAGEYKIRCHIEKAIVHERPIPIGDELRKRMRDRGAQQYKISCYSDRLELGLIKPESYAKSKDKADLPLEDGSYWRETPASRKQIMRLHNILSNQFRTWLKKNNYTGIIQENNRVDTEFWINKTFCRAELKVCRGSKPLWSIREAIGQLLQYDHYGERKSANHLYIILDSTPSTQDKSFVRDLRQKYGIPLALGWRVQGSQEFKLEDVF